MTTVTSIAQVRARFLARVNRSPLSVTSIADACNRIRQRHMLDTERPEQIAIGAMASDASKWIGDIGHLYINLAETLDLSVQVNREKFMLSGHPVDLGANGQLPTGNVPKFYFDGAVAAWNNLGSAGAFTVRGALTTGLVP